MFNTLGHNWQLNPYQNKLGTCFVIQKYCYLIEKKLSTNLYCTVSQNAQYSI
jgi:hypothetical protein